jgi:prepilin-type processing-associated H-X9-DG protein
MLLPFVEQEALRTLFDQTQDWRQVGQNRIALQTPLKMVQCPAAPGNEVRTRTTTELTGFGGGTATGTVSDYMPIGRIRGAVGSIPSILVPTTPSNYAAVMKPNALTRMVEVVDGLSNTLLLGESAGSPAWYTMGNLFGPDNGQAAIWTEHRLFIVLDGCNPTDASNTSTSSALYAARTMAMNCTNNDELYSFHSGGGNMLLGDGSVRFVSQNIPVGVVAALTTRANSEVLPNF